MAVGGVKRNHDISAAVWIRDRKQFLDGYISIFSFNRNNTGIRPL